MTAPWPPPPPQRSGPRPSSLGVIVFAVVLALLAQVGTVIAFRGATTVWGRWLEPPATTISPFDPEPSPEASGPQSPSSGPGVPEQSVGPFTVTEELRQGVVLISGRTPNEGVAGTGMVLTGDGHVLTNYHVVRSTESITVTIASTGERYDAQMIGRDATRDVALLKLEDARRLDVVRIDDDPVTVGDVVVAAGNANGQGYVTAHRGNVLGLGASIHVRSASPNDPPQRLTGLIETNAPAWPGDSGGPMFDAELDVLGMTTAGSGEDEDGKQVYAVPIRDALAVVDQIREGDESGTVVIGPRAYLGVVVQTDENVQVLRVEPGTPAAVAGLVEGDVITALDGQQVKTRADLSAALDGIEPDTTVDIAWTTSSGQRRDGTITVTASPVN